MKRKKYFLLLLFIPMVLFSSMLTTDAKSWSSSIKVSNLPTWGKVKDLKNYNTKTTTTQMATFKATQISALLPCFAHLRDSNGFIASEWGYLQKGTYNAKENSAKKGVKYYVSVKTSDLEFGSGNSVTFRFSSDKMN